MLEGMPHGDDIKTGRAQLRMRQGANQGAKTEFRANTLHGGLGDIEPGHFPGTAVHVGQEGTAPTTEVQQPAFPSPGKNLAFLGRLLCGAESAETPARSPRPRGAMGPIYRGIELTDRSLCGPGIGKAKAAFLALNYSKPQAGAARRGIRRFHQRRPVSATAQEAIGLFPVDRRPVRSGRHGQVSRKEMHPLKSHPPTPAASYLGREIYPGPGLRSIASVRARAHQRRCGDGLSKCLQCLKRTRN